MILTPLSGAPILSARAPTFAEWEAFCAASPEASPFHTPHWSRAVTSALPDLRAAPRMFHFADGVTALFPMHERGPRGRLCRAASLVPGVYGGPIGGGTLTQAHVTSLAAYYADHSLGGCSVFGNPLAPWSLPPGAGGATDTRCTHVLSLDGGMGPIWHGMTKGHRCNVKQASRSGITFSVASGRDDVTAYYSVYLDSIRRWGENTRMVHPETLFHLLLAEGGAFARLWLARSEGEVVSGALVLYWGESAVYWHGATLERAFPMRPSHGVVMAAIEDAAARGYRRFDFNPSSGLQGVMTFKQGFGALPAEFVGWELPARPAARWIQRALTRLSRRC